jgi:hypothetical protein
MPEIDEPVALYSVPSGKPSRAYFQVNPKKSILMLFLFYIPENPWSLHVHMM